MGAPRAGAIARGAADPAPPAAAASAVAAFLYFVAALVPVIGLADRGWQPYRYSRWSSIPWAELVVLYAGTLAAAVAAVPVARLASGPRALAAAGLVHLAGVLVTAAVSAFVIVPRLPGGVFQGGADAMRGVPITVEEVARGVWPYLAVQSGLGVAVALVLRWWTRSARLRRGSDLATPPPRRPWPEDAAFAALAVACFLAVEAYPAMEVAGRVMTASMKSRGWDPRDVGMRTALATCSIPIVLGIVVAASSAGALARSRPAAAAALGGSLHFLVAFCIAPLAAPAYVARELAALRPVRDAVLIGSHWFVGPYGAGIYMVLIPAVIAQAVIGALSALLFWALAHRWSGGGAGQTIRATRS